MIIYYLSNVGKWVSLRLSGGKASLACRGYGPMRIGTLRPVGEKVVEFHEEQFLPWFGEAWQRGKDGQRIRPQCRK